MKGILAAGSQLTAIPERISARSSSIRRRPFLVSMCQKVQPLQAPEPCATAPMRWIEPTLSPSMMAPSARTRAPWRFLESTSLVPGEIMPRSISSENATRGASRAVMQGPRVAFGQGFDRGDAFFGRRRIGLVALETDVAAAETFCHSACRAGAVEGIDHEIAGFGRRQQHARQQALGL